MREEAHKAWKGGEIYFFEISFHVVGNWKKLYFEREYPVYCLERSMKLHPVARRDTGFHENIWETTRRAWYPRIVHLFAANLKSKSVHGRTRSNENIQESIVRYIGSVRRVRKEEKIKDSGNKTSLWLILLRIYRLYNCRHQFAREGNNFKMIISINWTRFTII